MSIGLIVLRPAQDVTQYSLRPQVGSSNLDWMKISPRFWILNSCCFLKSQSASVIVWFNKGRICKLCVKASNWCGYKIKKWELFVMLLRGERWVISAWVRAALYDTEWTCTRGYWRTTFYIVRIFASKALWIDNCRTTTFCLCMGRSYIYACYQSGC
jgi:hypothetical protein